MAAPHGCAIPTVSERPALTVPEAGPMLGMSRNAIYAAVRAGTIPSVKVSPHRTLIPTAKLREMFGLGPED